MKTKLVFSWALAILVVTMGACSSSDDSIKEMSPEPPEIEQFVMPRSETFIFS